MRQSNFELLAPAPIMLLVMSAAAFLAAIGTFTWNNVALGPQAFFVVIGGCVFFTAGAFGAQYLFENNYARRSFKHHPALTARVVPIKWIILSGLVLIAIVVRVIETVSMARAAGLDASSYGDMAEWVRQETYVIFSTESVRSGMGFSFIERQLEKLVSAVGYLSGFSVGMLAARKPSLRRLEWPFVTLGLSCVFGILTGGRSAAMHFIVAIPIAWYIERLRLNDSGKRLAVRFARFAVPSVIVLLLVFYASSVLVSRKTSFNLIQYISFYFGCGIPSLQQRFKIVILQSQHFGERTFAGLHTLLFKTGIVDSMLARGSEFIYLGDMASNVNTMFYAFYVDFGFLGVILMSALSGFVYTVLYIYARTRKFSWAYVSIYTMIATGLLDLNRGESLFSAHLSINHLIRMLIMYVIVVWLFFPKNKEERLIAYARSRIDALPIHLPAGRRTTL